MLRFLVEYYKPEDKGASRLNESMRKRAIVEAILDKHNASTAQRKFNALFATSGIIHAIDIINFSKRFRQSARRRTAIMSR